MDSPAWVVCTLGTRLNRSGWLGICAIVVGSRADSFSYRAVQQKSRRLDRRRKMNIERSN